MYNFSIKNNSLGISTLFHCVNNTAFCIVVEANEWHLRQKDDNTGIHQLLFKAFHLIKADETIDNIPSAFANNLDVIIKKSNKENNQYEGLNFTGVSLTPQKVFVCTASYCRVHLIKNAELLKVTRDHNLVSDFGETEDNQRLNINFEDNQSVFFSHTRTLGFEAPNKPPETISWNVEGEYSIFICSDRYHNFRDPTEYITSFTLSESLTKHQTSLSGVIAKIDYKQDLYI
jgi:serine/threonine protein phosphatase PrpC